MLSTCINIYPGKKQLLKHLKMEMSGFNGILELLSFGVINGIPAYMIVKNRGLTHEHSVRSGLIGFGMYSTLYVGLQLGGFWTHLFGLPESAI